MKELEYPFDSEWLLRKKRSLKKELLFENKSRLVKRIAILGGSTTSNIKEMLELFLLNYDIEATFYESEYNKFFEDAMFENKKLEEFSPDIIYIHTTNRNIMKYPNLSMDKSNVESILNQEYEKFEKIWNRLAKVYKCPIIQNNFELPYYRLLGNIEASDYRGKVNYITKLNMKFYDYASEHEKFYIQDINYLSATYGIERWNNNFYWYMYKYALDVSAMPFLAFNLANMIKSIYGKNKKGMVLDLDNTLWGGVIGDDGQENIQIGHEISAGQAFYDFQYYIKEYKQLGIILNVNSKNEYENAILGLEHPDGLLKPEDFIVIKSNWNPKSKNLVEIADELNLGVDSLVFIDDNPAERAIINQQIPSVATPIIDVPENYINIIDKSAFFEVTSISMDDLRKNEMYKENVERNKLLSSFDDYGAYLESLEMKAVIRPFESVYMARIAQLTNKSNQFNLTTKRYTQSEIETVAEDENYITLYGKLEDVFGDNGVVSVIIGNKKDDVLHIDLWIMSCRVLKRDMEYAMMDTLISYANKAGIKEIIGYYYPTVKNGMVKDFYAIQSFEKIEEDQDGNTKWRFMVDKNNVNKNNYIKVEM
jgi:HAD-superfamily phosphatase, subfamily IIIC/FkbH-like domain